MVEAPERIWAMTVSYDGQDQRITERIWVEGPNPNCVGTEYVRSDIAERQNAELRAEYDKLLTSWAESRERHLAAEAENARLKALPLKDEVERVVNDAQIWISENVRTEDAVGNEILCEMRSLLSRLRAGEQEGWRSMDSAPKDGTRILVCRKRPKSGSMSKNPAIGSWNGLREGGARPGWVLEIKTNTYLVSNDELLGWQPLPAAPSEQRGDRS